MKYSWKTYNLKRINLSKKIIKFNRKNKINYIENGLYNHIRDIFCIGLLLLDKKKKLNKILDYGSNSRQNSCLFKMNTFCVWFIYIRAKT